MTSMQTARTLKPGRGSGYVALGSEGVRFTKKADDSLGQDLQNAIEKARIPVLEGGYRYGVSSGFDMGVRLALVPGTIGIDGKYQFKGADGPFAMATGLGLDYASFESKGDLSTSSTTLTDISIPLYMSYELSPVSTVYSTPRLIDRMTKVSSPEESSSSSVVAYGAAFGYMYRWFAAEYSVFSFAGGQSSFIVDQITLGVRIAYDNLSTPSRKHGRRHHAESSDD